MMFYRIYGKAVFPEGIAPGDGKGFSNMIVASRNGKNTPLLRGTSIAGALRSAFKKLSPEDVNLWFGQALGEEGQSAVSQNSLVYVADMPLHTSNGDSVEGASEIRTHNLNNRHTGSVVKGGLFSIEAFPPLSTGDFLLYVKSSGDRAKDDEFSEFVETVLASSIYLGGNRNRGIGRLELQNVSIAPFDTSCVEGLAQWMNVRYEDRLGNYEFFKGEPVVQKQKDNSLKFELKLSIPRGEDFVIGYGISMDNLQSEPQFVVKADGKKYWRIPGASFRGLFRGWMTRLAAREGKMVGDSAQLFSQSKALNGDDIGHGFIPKDQWEGYQFGKGGKKLDDPIADLFGSLFRQGRIHFGDAFSTTEAKASDTQLRMHVAVDRFSGGANEGGLFSNKVLVGNIGFVMPISIEQPSADEKRWLCQTIKALNLGVISVGNSKGSGLLQVDNMADIEKILNGGV